MDHPLRATLANELHSRPFLRIAGSVALTHYAIYDGHDTNAASHHALLASLCRLTGLPQPAADANHFAARWSPDLQLKWELHTEFSTFTFVARRHDANYFSGLETAHLPAEWLRSLAGKRLVAVRIEFVSGDAGRAARASAGDWMDKSSMVGSRVLDGAQVFCDWNIRPDGYLRFLVIDNGLRQVQGGRLVQRLYEIETYRMMALLTLPVARTLGTNLDALQRSLTPLMQRMDESRGRSHDAELLAQLTHMAAGMEALSDAASRFSATRAYERLVHARISELREQRIDGFPTIAEFLGRRFGPAMATCRSVWARHEQVAERIARVVALLRTRVSVAQEEDTTRLLESMNRTVRSQLRLQHAVEGLSVAAISYYVLALSGAALRSLHAAHFLIEPEFVEGWLVLPVVATVLLLVRRKRRLGSTSATADGPDPGLFPADAPR